MIRIIILLGVFVSISLSTHQLTKINDKYYVSHVELNFVQSYVACKKNGLIFATEQNQTETDAINDVLLAANHTNYGHWLGGINITRSELKIEWLWLDTNTKISDYTRWATDEPTGIDNNCLYRAGEGLWLALHCTRPFYFLCQEP